MLNNIHTWSSENIKIRRKDDDIITAQWRNFLSFCVRVFNLRSCDMRLILGRVLCITTQMTDGWMLLVRKKLPLNRWPSLLYRYAQRGQREERRAQASPKLVNICNNIWMNRTPAQPQVKQNLLRTNYLKYLPLWDITSLVYWWGTNPTPLQMKTTVIYSQDVTT